jgi:hypothetical protein
MAEEIRFEGATVKVRHPWLAWLLALVTLGVYGLVWHYKVNEELRAYSAAVGRPLGNDPTLSLLALFPGALLYIPPIVTVAGTAWRIRLVRQLIGPGDPERPWPWLSVVLHILLFSNIVYMQRELNLGWEAARGRARTPG